MNKQTVKYKKKNKIASRLIGDEVTQVRLAVHTLITAKWQSMGNVKPDKPAILMNGLNRKISMNNRLCEKQLTNFQRPETTLYNYNNCSPHYWSHKTFTCITLYNSLFAFRLKHTHTHETLPQVRLFSTKVQIPPINIKERILRHLYIGLRMVPPYMSPNATVLPCPVHTKGTGIGFLAGVGIHVLTEVGLVSCHVGAVSAYVRASRRAPPHAHRTVRVRRGLPGRETTHLGTASSHFESNTTVRNRNSYCYLYYLANIIYHFDKWRPEKKLNLFICIC